MSDETIRPAQIRAARALLAWSPADLAQESGAPEADVARIEAGGGEAGLRAKVVTTLEAAGVRFLAESDGEGVGVRLAKPRSAPREIAIDDLNASNDE